MLVNLASALAACSAQTHSVVEDSIPFPRPRCILSSSLSTRSSSFSYPPLRDHLTTRRPSEELTLPAVYRALASPGLLMLIGASGFVPSRRVADASNILINIVIKPASRQLPAFPLHLYPPSPLEPSRESISARASARTGT